MFGWSKNEQVDWKKKYQELHEDYENACEANGSLRSQATQAQIEMRRMQIAHTEPGLNEIATVTAKRIEDLFASAMGSRDRRFDNMVAILREVMRANLTGSTNWKGPGEPTYKTEYTPTKEAGSGDSSKEG